MGGAHTTWTSFCHELKHKLVRADHEEGAKQNWNLFLNDHGKRNLPQGYPSSALLYESRRKRNLIVTSQQELLQLLPGSTWRKPNGLETVIFQQGGKFYNNHAGYPIWRENSYQVVPSQSLTITLTWSVDGFQTNIIFESDFGTFQEELNPYDGRWELVALKQHTPGWGI
ncbi:expressed unknown protein [Seminavis robusta]|uniref:Uncharacterized protein n=1 Tax=Seminavis robusta TaxID=568900 RepID=A0A9N8DQE6_9STRA|nr:expressed unknown protein [Seminavis robusta]|eukprot:Sro273_g105040.1 n/a (170) ;mRNA; f:11446-11955